MNYAGSQFGGLEVYKSLFNRYGDSSLVAYSQFVSDELVRQYDFRFNFIEKGTNALEFLERVLQEIKALRYAGMSWITSKRPPNGGSSVGNQIFPAAVN